MSDRKITVKSGNEESTLEVTEEEYRNYYRPWWQQKKREQRNREAMEANGYTEESYAEWLGQKENPQGKGWAAGAGYGEKILSILKNIVS